MKRGVGRWWVWWLIARRIEYTGRPCFSYDGIEATYKYYRACGERIPITLRTVFRVLRRLAEDGFLSSNHNGVFCLENIPPEVKIRVGVRARVM